MYNQEDDFRKFKCAQGPCKAMLPDVYCERVAIARGEIPYFIELLDALGDEAVLSYHVLPPKFGSLHSDRDKDKTWIFIWVDPHRHHDPKFLVQAAANIAFKGFTMQQELDYLDDEDRDEQFRQTCREVNCTVCVKNHLQDCRRAMTQWQYMRALAATAGIFD